LTPENTYGPYAIPVLHPQIPAAWFTKTADTHIGRRLSFAEVVWAAQSSFRSSGFCFRSFYWLEQQHRAARSFRGLHTGSGTTGSGVITSIFIGTTDKVS